MDSPFSSGDSSITKLKAAKECLIAILSHLNADDKVGIVLFSNEATVENSILFLFFMKFIHKLVGITGTVSSTLR